MRHKATLYALGVGIFGLAGAIFNHVFVGKPIKPEGLVAAIIFVPIAGYLIWLRWDWAPAQRRAAQARRLQQRDDA